MKKILVIAEHYPLPENSGTNKRTMLFVRYFKQLADIDIAYSEGPKPEELDTSLFRNVIHIHRTDYPRTFTDKLPLLLKGLPACVQGRHSRAVKAKLLALIEKEQYDLIFIRYMFNAQYFIGLSPEIRKKIVIDVDDIVSGPLYDLTYAVQTRYALKKKVDHWQVRQFERTCCKSVGKVLFCSDADAARIPAGNKYVVPNVMDAEGLIDYSFGDGSANGNVLMFIGTLNYWANIEGLEWFIQHIFPVFKKAHPDGTLLVVGRKPKECVRTMCQREGIELHADVPDVRPFYRQSRVIVVPLLKGSGTRIKILEAALTRRPIISTPVGAEGLILRDDKEILLFNDAEQFMKQYEKTLNASDYAEYAGCAYETTLAQYSVAGFNRTLDMVFNQAGS